MSLTKQDLAAIEKLIEASEEKLIKQVETSVETSENRMITRIDDLDDTLSIQVENGLQEVRDQLNGVKESVDGIGRVQQAELERNDRQDASIKHIRKSLHAA